VVRSYSQTDLFVAPLGSAAGTARNLTETFDSDIGGALTGDQHAPRGSLPAGPIWLDATHVAEILAKEGRANLLKVDVTACTLTPFTTGNQEVMAVSASKDASRIVALISTPTMIGDLFVIDGKTGAQTRLTDVNKTLMSELKLTEPEEIWYQSFDGKKIQGWV